MGHTVQLALSLCQASNLCVGIRAAPGQLPLVAPCTRHAGGSASPPHRNQPTQGAMEDFRQKMTNASALLDGLAQPLTQNAGPSVSDPDPGLATAAPEQPSTPPFERHRETTPCFDGKRLRHAWRQRPLQNSQVGPTSLIKSVSTGLLPSLLENCGSGRRRSRSAVEKQTIHLMLSLAS